MSVPISPVELYSNALYEGHFCHRYWLEGTPIMVGGSVLGPDDWAHLQRDFGITDVVNVETEHDDTGKLPPESLCQARVPDDGTPFPADKVLLACFFVARKLYLNTGFPPSKFYVHCQMGGSRSPAFAYAVMRGALGFSPERSIQVIRSQKADYGHHHYHTSYIDSVERALNGVP